MSLNDALANLKTREDAIQVIEGLWPVDSQFIETAQIGQQLLNEARDRVGASDWRLESEEVLLAYAMLCLLREWNIDI